MCLRIKTELSLPWDDSSDSFYTNANDNKERSMTVPPPTDADQPNLINNHQPAPINPYRTAPLQPTLLKQCKISLLTDFDNVY